MGNLLIIGDSFCMDKEYWPKDLHPRLLTMCGDLRVSSAPGRGWWAIRHNLLQIKNNSPDWFAQLKTLVIIHTFTHRLLSGNDGVEQGVPESTRSWNLFKNFDSPEMAYSLYYKYIYDYEFHHWAQIKWLDELADILQSCPDILTVHLFADAETHDLVKHSRLSSNSNTLIVPTPLMDIVRLQWPADEQFVMQNDGATCGFRNHLSTHNNKILAEQLYEIINFERADFDLARFKPLTQHEMNQ